MGFSAKQIQALRRDLDTRHVRSRNADGRELSYIEGWFVISEANRIFGFDGWNRETVESRCVLARENRGSFLAVYIAKVRITVRPMAPRSSAKAMAPAKAAGRPPVKFTISHSRPQKPTLPNEPWRPSEDLSGLSSIARTRPHVRQIHAAIAASDRQAAPPSRASVSTRTIRRRSRGPRITTAGAQSSMDTLLRTDRKMQRRSA